MNGPTDYKPIDCSVHDRLEALATLKVRCFLRWTDEGGNAREARSRIKDIFARSGEEFVLLETGESVRLDRIESISEG